MGKFNIVLISLDEVRPDHLGCYGYSDDLTPAIDEIARGGVRFTQCISSSDFTPVAMGSVITGRNPNKHGMRDAFSHLAKPNIATILKENGYTTAGFVGNGLLSEKHDFSEGFDFWNEASKETSWLEIQYPDAESRDVDELIYEGNYWVDELFSWLEANRTHTPFFVWGHLYETHEGAEESLLRKGVLEEGVLPEFGYYDAKIKMADENLIARLIADLKQYGLWDNTIVVVMSDHGTNLGEHSARDIPWRKPGTKYPQHTTMYDHDLRIALLLKGAGLPAGKAVDGLARGIDLVPTLLDLVGIDTSALDLDGESLLPAIESGLAAGREAYSEDLFEPRGKGAIHSLRTESAKFIRNLTLGEEEYYDLTADPLEQDNLLGSTDGETLVAFRKKLNRMLFTRAPFAEAFSDTEREAINRRLQALGYVD